MADWTDPPYSALVVDKAWTDAKAIAAFENVVALSEGAPGAPKIVGNALDLGFGYTVCNTTARAISAGALNTRYVRFKQSSVNSGSSGTITATIRVRASNNNGVSWGSWVTVKTSSVPSGGSPTTVSLLFDGYIDLTNGNIFDMSSSISLGLTDITDVEYDAPAGSGFAIFHALSA